MLVGQVLWKVERVWFSIVYVCSSLLYPQEETKEFSDEELVLAIQKGAKDKFEIIVNRYSSKIFRYLYYRFHFSKSLSEELVQDVFVKVWVNIGTFQESKKFSSWIYMVAHNLSVDRLRKNNNELKNSITPMDYEDARDFWDDIQSKDNVKKDTESDFKKTLLWKLLDELWEKYREAMILYYFEEKNYEEIAEIMWSNKNTIWSLISRAKKKLKETIEKDNLLKDALTFDL